MGAFPSLVIPELHLVGVADAGVPNQERIIIRPTQKLWLNGYGLALGLPDPQGQGAYPLFDNCFWFPELDVSPPAWILVYTGRGTVNTSKWHNGEDVLSLHWQRQYTVFSSGRVVPILFRVGGAIVGSLF